MDQHLRYVKAMQDQASALAAGVQTLQKQLSQLQFNDEEADTELRPIQEDVNRTSQDLSRLIEEQKVKNAEAEKLEEQALQARLHAEAAADRIQQCQTALQTAERLLAQKQRQLTDKKQEAQFKAAELEFHKQQLQHVSKEQRQAEEQIHSSLGGTQPNGVPTSGPAGPNESVQSPTRGLGSSVMSKVTSSMDRAKLMGQKVVPTFNKDRKAQAIAGQQEAALADGSDLVQTSQQQETVFAPHSL